MGILAPAAIFPQASVVLARGTLGFAPNSWAVLGAPTHILGNLMTPTFLET